MTGALHLFYIWKSPARRSQEQVAGLEVDHQVPDPDLRGFRRDHHHYHRRSDGDPFRHPHGAPPKNRHSKNCGSHRERELGRPNRNDSDGNLHGNRTNGGVSNIALTQLGLTRHDQLPSAVEEARKRLLERLRSVLLIESRQSIPDAGVLNNELTEGDFLVVNHSNLNHEVLGQMTRSNIMYGEPTIQTQHLSSFLDKKKKIPTLNWDAFCTMQGETFRSSEDNYEVGNVEALTECCICLEGFMEEDRLVKLCCNHKFHPSCLEPWVRSAGDCPLCRADIN